MYHPNYAKWLSCHSFARSVTDTLQYCFYQGGGSFEGFKGRWHSHLLAQTIRWLHFLLNEIFIQNLMQSNTSPARHPPRSSTTC